MNLLCPFSASKWADSSGLVWRSTEHLSQGGVCESSRAEGYWHVEWQLFGLHRWNSCQATDGTDVECTHRMLTALNEAWENVIGCKFCCLLNVSLTAWAECTDANPQLRFYGYFYCCWLWKMVNLRHSSAPTGKRVDQFIFLVFFFFASIYPTETWAHYISKNKT